MKKFFGTLLFLGLVCFSYDASAQALYVSSKMKPIMKGDSVLVMYSWADPSFDVSSVEFKGFYSPDETDMKNRQFAMYIYPKATRKFVPTIISLKGNKKNIYPTFLKLLTITVLDENGNEVKDEYSDVENAPVDFRKLDVTGKTPSEMLQAYNLTHKEISAKKETAENSATEQKTQDTK